MVSGCDRVSIGYLTGVGTTGDKYATITFCWFVRASHFCKLCHIELGLHRISVYGGCKNSFTPLYLIEMLKRRGERKRNVSLNK